MKSIVRIICGTALITNTAVFILYSYDMMLEITRTAALFIIIFGAGFLATDDEGDHE